jgi:hypothetical protein
MKKQSMKYGLHLTVSKECPVAGSCEHEFPGSIEVEKFLMT